MSQKTNNGWGGHLKSAGVVIAILTVLWISMDLFVGDAPDASAQEPGNALIGLGRIGVMIFGFFLYIWGESLESKDKAV